MTADTDAVRVLYVDADGERRTCVQTTFATLAPEHSLRTVETVGAGLDTLDGEDHPHCLVAAATSTDGDGLALLRAVRERWERLPVVLAVEDGSDELAAAAVDAGVTAYVPVDGDYSALVSRAVDLGRSASGRAYTELGEFLQDAVDALDDVFYVFDAEYGLVRWNDRLNEMFDLTSEELSGMHPNEFFVEADRPAVERAAVQALVDGETTVEARAETTEGLVTFELTGRRLTDPDGEFVGLCGVGRDVTDQRRGERQLRQQNERLEEFAGVVSHDLRNPLAISMGFLDIERETNDSPNLERVANALDRMSVIVEDVLTAARNGLVVDDPTPTAVAVVARDAWETVDTKEATLVVDAEHVVLAEADYLRRLFENLFRNSVEHGARPASGHPAPGDSVEHGSTSNRTQSGDSVEHAQEGVTVTVGDVLDGFYVADDGPGVPPSVSDTLFDVGVSTNDGGTGFGLSIVRSLATAHGWDATLAETDVGARFEFTNVSVVPDPSEGSEGSERER